MNTAVETNIGNDIVSNLIDRISLIGPFRKVDAKSTFCVTPLTHRKLDIVCECTGLTRQEIYTKALRYYLDGGYLQDIDPELLKMKLL